MRVGERFFEEKLKRIHPYGFPSPIRLEFHKNG
jgi:hypothetical protein